MAVCPPAGDSGGPRRCSPVEVLDVTAPGAHTPSRIVPLQLLVRLRRQRDPGALDGLAGVARRPTGARLGAAAVPGRLWPVPVDPGRVPAAPLRLPPAALVPVRGARPAPRRAPGVDRRPLVLDGG